MAKNNRMYSPTCQVCQYMRRNKDYTVAILLSSYFNPKGQESLPEVNKRFGLPFTLITLYKHAQRHMKTNTARWMKLNGLEDKKNWQQALEKTKFIKEEELEALQNTIEYVEDAKSILQPHEYSLDKFIKKGSDMVESGEMKITATTYIQAIKAKSDIEKSNKDRKMDALKTLFTGAAPKTDGH
jgi:hypothetical protein